MRTLIAVLAMVAGALLGPAEPHAFAQAVASPTGLTLYSYSTSRLHAQWTAAQGATGYYLDVATDLGFTNFVSGYNNLSVGNVVVQNIDGLSPATVYYARVRASNGSGTSANSATADGRTRAAPAYPVADYIKTGFLHWSHAHGDPFTDDSSDFDDSMGAHHCTMAGVNTGKVDPEDVFVQFSTDDFQCDLSTPAAGDYWLAVGAANAKNTPLRLQTCGGAGCSNFTTVTLDAAETYNTSLTESRYDWLLTVPSGQTTTRIRIAFPSPCTSPWCVNGFRRIEFVGLTYRVANGSTWAPGNTASGWFSSPPTNGVHPRLMFTPSELATLRAAVHQVGTPQNYLYTQMLQVYSCYVHNNPSGFSALGNGFHDFPHFALTSALGAVLNTGEGVQCPAGGPFLSSATLLTDAVTFVSQVLGAGWKRRCIAGPSSVCSNNSSLDCRQTWTNDQANCISGGGTCPPGHYQNCTTDADCPTSRCGTRFQLANDLDQANYTSAIALVYDMLYNSMTTQQRIDFANLLAEEADYAATAAHTGQLNFGIDARATNWRPHILDAVGQIGLVLDHFTAVDYVPLATDHMLIDLDTDFDSLGAAGDPSGYYTFGQEGFVEFADALRRSGGFDLFGYHGGSFGKSDVWMLDMMSGNHATVFPAGDTSHVEPWASWSVAALVKQYQSHLAAWLFNALYPDNTALNAIVSNYRERALFQTLLFLDQSVTSINPDGLLAPSRVYNDPMITSPGFPPGNAGFVFMRSSFGSTDALYLATQAGDQQGSHGHRDQGSLFLQAYGNTIFDDFGKQGDYGTPSQAWHAGELGHNSVLIDSKGQGSDSSVFTNTASVLTSVTPSFLSLASMDVKDAYNYSNYNTVLGAKRHALMVNTGTNRGYFLVIDDVNKDNALHTYALQYLAVGSATWSNVSANRYRLAIGDGGADIFLAEPTTTTYATGAAPVSASEAADYLTINSSQTHGYFVTLIFPTSTRLGVTVPTVTTIRDAAMSGFQLNGDTILFNRVGGLQAAANVQSDGELLFVRGTTSAQAFVATKATRLTYQGTPYLSAPQAPTAVAVEYTPAGLTAQLDMGSASSLTLALAATPAQVTFNGQSVPFTYAAGQLTITTLLGKGTLLVNTTSSGVLGDLDNNGLVDVLDLQHMVNVLLGLETDQAVIARADLDGVGGPTILDLQRLVNLLLGV